MARETNTNQWLDMISELQSSYWSTWGNAFKSNGKDSPGEAWNSALQSWQKLVGMDSNEEVLDTMLSQGRAFLQMSEDVLKAGAEGLDADTLLDGWSQGWHQAMGAGDGLAALWGMPQDTLRRTLSAFSAAPGDMLEQYKQEGVSKLVDSVREQAEKVLSVPALGYTRESQEEQQRFAREAIEFQAALQNYSAILAKAGRQAIDRLQDKLAEASEPGRGIDSLRALYDVWVDASEEAYAEAALSDEFQVVYGDLVNSMMRLKRHAQDAVEHQLGALGVPGRRELNSAHQIIHGLRREVSGLRSELAGMRREIDAIKQAGQKKTSRKKSAAKKRSGSKSK